MVARVYFKLRMTEKGEAPWDCENRDTYERVNLDIMLREARRDKRTRKPKYEIVKVTVTEEVVV